MSSEVVNQQQARLIMARLGGQIWRNNSGAYQDERGNFIRYGLANESKQQNDKIKSSDLIGITPLLVTPEMVGRWVGIFTALECKPSGWHLTPGNKRGVAQERFISIVKNVGGFAGFVTDQQDVYRIIGQ